MYGQIRLVAAIDAQLRRLPQAGGSLSAATFAPREVTRSAAMRDPWIGRSSTRS